MGDAFAASSEVDGSGVSTPLRSGARRPGDDLPDLAPVLAFLRLEIDR